MLSKVSYRFNAIPPYSGDKSGGFILSDLSLYCKATVIKKQNCWNIKTDVSRWNRIEGPEINTHMYSQQYSTRVPRIHSKTRRVSLGNSKLANSAETCLGELTYKGKCSLCLMFWGGSSPSSGGLTTWDLCRRHYSWQEHMWQPVTHNFNQEAESKRPGKCPRTPSSIPTTVT